MPRLRSFLYMAVRTRCQNVTVFTCHVRTCLEAKKILFLFSRIDSILNGSYLPTARDKGLC